MFLTCPKCLAARPASERQIGFACRACFHKWDPPHPGCVSAYHVQLSELELCLLLDTGEQVAISSLPFVIGRDSECLTLQRNTAISRRHCQIGFDAKLNSFVVTDLRAQNSTTVDGRTLQTDETLPFQLDSELRLAGVRVSLVPRLRRAPNEAPRSDAKPGDRPIDLNFAGSTAFVGLDQNARIALAKDADRLREVLVCFIWTGDRDRCRAIVLARKRVFVNGEIVLEAWLRPADQVQIADELFEYSATQRRLQPKLPDNGARVVAKHVRVSYGTKSILDDVTCTIPSRSLTAIVGKSGSGKTTLIKVLSGLRRQDSGDLEVTGLQQEPTNYSAWALNHFALVPQHDVVHGELTIGQCLNYAARLRLGSNPTADTKNERIARALQDTDLVTVSAETRISALSGGQRHRVNIAAELLAAPEGLLLDEPTSGLDCTTEKLVISVLKRLASQGKTVVFVTHSLAALDDVDHVILLGSGTDGASVAREGPPRDLKKQFGTESWTAIFEQLFPSEILPPQIQPHRPEPQRVEHRRYIIPKTLTLAQRYGSIWMSNPAGSTAILFGLPLLLGILIRLAVSTDSGSGTDRLLFGVISALWIGMNQSVREIVREKTILIQELCHNLGCASYLFSKVAFFVPVAFLQAVLLSIPLKWIAVSDQQIFFSASELRCPWWLIIAMFWTGGTMGSILGLTISSMCLFLKEKGEVVATFVVVLVILPQILFSSKVLPSPGLAKTDRDFFSFSTPQVAPIPEHLSFLTCSRYLYLPLDAASRYPTNEVLNRSLAFNGTILLVAGITILISSWIILEFFLWKWKHLA
jgi:ABC transport system ATP-binding/permease protein